VERDAVSARRVTAIAVLFLLLVTGCTGSFGLHDRGVIGASVAERQYSLAIDSAILPALTDTLRGYDDARRMSTDVVAGTSRAVAEAVKAGDTLDVVIVGGSSPLRIVRDELAGPPTQLGAYDGTTFWAAPVTTFGLKVARFLGKKAALGALVPDGILPPTPVALPAGSP
jgi:hypothetical protein